MVAFKLLALVASVGAPNDFVNRVPTRVSRRTYPTQLIRMTRDLTPALRSTKEQFECIREDCDLLAEQNAANYLILQQYVDKLIAHKNFLYTEWASCVQRWQTRALQDIFLMLWLCAFVYGQRKRS
jgi:hypothetical protein